MPAGMPSIPPTTPSTAAAVVTITTVAPGLMPSARRMAVSCVRSRVLRTSVLKTERMAIQRDVEDIAHTVVGHPQQPGRDDRVPRLLKPTPAGQAIAKLAQVAARRDDVDEVTDAGHQRIAGMNRDHRRRFRLTGK